MKNIFKDHPSKVGETYFEHFLKAFGFGIKLILISIRVCIHAIFPWCFEHSASDRVSKLHDVLQNRKKSANPDEN